MSAIRNQGIANAAISFIGVALGYLYTGILGPFILTPGQIGLTSTLMAVGLIASHVAKLGGPFITLRFYPIFKNSDKDKQGFLNFLLILTWAGFLLFLLLYILFQPLIVRIFSVNSALFVDYNKLAIAVVFFMSFFEIFQAYSRVILRTVIPGVLREIVWRIVIISALLCYYKHLIDFTTFVWIYSFAYALPVLMMVIYLIVLREMKFNTYINIKGRAGEIMKYGNYVFFGSVATVTINEIDKVMIASLAGLSSTGIYQVAAYFSLVIQVPARSIMMIAGPLVAVFLANNEMDKVERVYKKSSVNQLIAGLYIFTGIYVNLDNIFRILPPPFSAGRYVIIFIALGKLFDMATGVNGDIIVNSKYFRFDFYFNLALVVMIVAGDYFLIPLYGITGAAIASAITIFLYNVAKSWFIWIVYRIQPFSIHMLSVVGIGILVIIIDHFLPTLKSVLPDILYRSLVLTIVYGTLILISGASEDLNDIVRKWLNKFTV